MGNREKLIEAFKENTYEQTDRKSVTVMLHPRTHRKIEELKNNLFEVPVSKTKLIEAFCLYVAKEMEEENE